MKTVPMCCLALSSLPLAAADFHDPNADREALPTVPPGFEVSFFAREPLVRQPCSMAFDARGRLCVGMGPQYRNPQPATPGDSVVLVLDTDGDGTADQTRTFATGFNAIQGMAWHGSDLWVANAPDLTVVRDLDGDDQADEYVRVYTDLGNLEHGLHGLNWAPDGKLYMSKGNSKGLTQPGRVAPRAFRELWGVTAPAGSPDFPEPRTFQKDNYEKAYHDPADDWGREGGVLRCDDGGANLEIVARGFRNPWDITFDTNFNWLGTDNDQTTGDRVFMPFFGAHFGWNHPWSAHWGSESHPPSAPVSGPLFEGSGTGVIFGDSPQFPATHRGVFFINDWLRKTTFVWRPRWDGALLRPAGEGWEPFVSGGKALFRPTDLEVGPDGALWILGWSAGYGAEYKDGQMTSEGRVFRVVSKSSPLAPWLTPKRRKPLAQWSVAELAEDFDGPLPVWRIDAQDELVRRGMEVKAELFATLGNPDLSEARQTWIAWTLGRLAPEDRAIDEWFATRLADAAERLNLRVQAMRILGHRARQAGGQREWPTGVLNALRSPEARLRFEAVQAISQARQTSARPALLEALAIETDPTTFYAGWQALRSLQTPAQLKPLLADPRAGVRKAALLALLEGHALSESEVQPLASDPDPTVKDLALLWLQKVRAGGEQVVVRGRPLDAATPDSTKTQEPLELKPPSNPTSLDAALALLGQGDRDRGERLFHAPGGTGCFNCHRLGDHGNAFGPDLAALGERATARHIVQSILEPNAVITEGFNLLTVTTPDAEHAGILLEESGLSLTLGLATGQRQVIPKSKVTSRQTAATSAMPGYGALLTPQSVADLGAFLLAQKADEPGAARSKGDGFRSSETANRLVISHDGQAVAEFVFQDEKIARPYFANVHAPGGSQVTRNHPPVAGTDAMDHDTMHPGIWLAFGDINGADFWRNKGRIEHVRFTEPPAARDGRLTFATECRLRSAEGRTLCSLTNRFTLTAPSNAWLLVWDAAFRSEDGDFSFGDQEEMGFGARVATAITEKNGGLITSSTGQKTAKATWGQPADWCDYSGVAAGRPIGLTLMADPRNFRPSWWHNRDYGVFVANPFGREAMKQGAKSAVTIKRGEDFRLRFGAAIHRGAEFSPAVAYREFLESTQGKAAR